MNNTNKNLSTALLIIGIVLYMVAIGTFYKGYDKMHHYYKKSENYSSSEDVNVYVGGDAYNYIINGNYSTAYYTLTAGLIISGTIFVCSSVVTGKLEENTEAVRKPKPAQVYVSPEDSKKAALNDALKF